MKTAAVAILLAVLCIPALAFQDTNPNSSSGAAAQQPKLTQEQVEAIKAANARALRLNAIIPEANNALSAKDWQKAAGILQEMIAIAPSRWQFYEGLANAQFKLNDYATAAQTYEKGVEVALKDPTVNANDESTDPEKKKAGMARMLTNEGNAYVKLKNLDAAIIAYRRAAELDPYPAIAWFNICAVQYNTGQVKHALEACDKAIAADPSRADAYFIKGSLLIADSKPGASGRMQAPPGTEEALKKYLELAPQGSHADDVKAMLNFIGSKVETTYQKKN